MRFLLTIGGAGAQKEIFAAIIKKLLPAIKAGKAALYVNVGDYKNVWEQLVTEIPQLGHIAHEHFDDWDETKRFAAQALEGEVRGIHGFYHSNILRRSTAPTCYCEAAMSLSQSQVSLPSIRCPSSS